MAVPQGSTRAEWLDCYHRLTELPGIDLIGLSKLSVPRCFDAPVAEARLDCVDTLLTRDDTTALHLLGGDRSLSWELAEHRRRGHHVVCGNDSSFAYWYPATGISVDEHTGRAAREPADKPDLTATTLSRQQVATAHHHIDLLRHAAGLSSVLDDNTTPTSPTRSDAWR